ncbi:hypothetical protein CVIRNUC_003835 [Coccomyxa viridis]|uniref:HTH HARE-type domain-containing protein n=1 Tax=Coccomyxa viridis TaxID=1274662 RepID=A0AAV1I2Q7_9CHLO|nr:hypothetical protein CVIRNUC_003835 [Coccomyxa viridis]
MSGLQQAVKLLEGKDRAWMPPPDARQGPRDGLNVPVASEIQVMEVEAFCGVHDMIHAAILSHGSQASLREIYRACEMRGRIAYKRSGGSRLITHNDHWKSQIRHALYTSDRFVRASEGADCWTVPRNYTKVVPATTMVLVRTSGEGTAVIDEGPLSRGPSRGPRRLTRSKHALEDGALPVSPRRKRTRMTRAASRFEPGSAADNDDPRAGRDSASPDLSDGMASGAGQQSQATASPEEGRAGPSGFQGSAQGMEGIDESSQNDLLVPRAARTPSTAPRARRLTPSTQQDEETVLFTNSVMHPCRPETDADAGGAPQPASGGRGGLAGGRGRWGQRLTLSSQRNSHWGRSTQTLEEPPAAEKPLEGSNSPVNGASVRRARSAEAESPPATQLYALRSRAAAPPHRSPPGFGYSPDPEAAAAADHAASTTMGPIKSRLKAAAKAAAAAEAASAARAAHEEACSTYTHDEVAALEFQAHTSAEPRNLRRKSAGDDADAHQAAAEPEEAPAQARPRSGSRAGTPLLEASDSGRKRGGKGRVPVKLLDQVQQRHNATQITGGSSAHLVPQTPSMTARQLHPGLQSYSSTPGATPSLTPPRTLMSSLQGAASSVAAANKGAEMLLAYNEELPPEDCTEGADESDDGGARRMLRSHAAAAAAAAAGSRGAGAGFKHAALQVLQSTSEAMTAKQLTQAAIHQGLISSSGNVQVQMPESMMASSLSSDIRQKDRRSAFTKPEEGKFGLRAWHE